MDRDAALTDPTMAKKFIEETGIDCLAVAIGTAHGAYNVGQKPYLDYERLQEIKKVTNNFPLVLLVALEQEMKVFQRLQRWELTK